MEEYGVQIGVDGYITLTVEAKDAFEAYVKAAAKVKGMKRVKLSNIELRPAWVVDGKGETIDLWGTWYYISEA